jgi:hypothetical protein
VQPQSLAASPPCVGLLGADVAGSLQASLEGDGHLGPGFVLQQLTGFFVLLQLRTLGSSHREIGLHGEGCSEWGGDTSFWSASAAGQQHELDRSVPSPPPGGSCQAGKLTFARQGERGRCMSREGLSGSWPVTHSFLPTEDEDFSILLAALESTCVAGLVALGLPGLQCISAPSHGEGQPVGGSVSLCG